MEKMSESGLKVMRIAALIMSSHHRAIVHWCYRIRLFLSLGSIRDSTDHHIGHRTAPPTYYRCVA